MLCLLSPPLESPLVMNTLTPTPSPLRVPALKSGPKVVIGLRGGRFRPAPKQFRIVQRPSPPHSACPALRPGSSLSNAVSRAPYSSTKASIAANLDIPLGNTTVANLFAFARLLSVNTRSFAFTDLIKISSPMAPTPTRLPASLWVQSPQTYKLRLTLPAYLPVHGLNEEPYSSRFATLPSTPPAYPLQGRFDNARFRITTSIHIRRLRPVV